MQDTLTIDPTWTVNKVVALYPATVAVFNRFGVDSCCGGGVALGEAAARDGVGLDALLQSLRDAVERS